MNGWAIRTAPMRQIVNTGDTKPKTVPVYMSPSPHLSREDFVSMLDDFGMRDELFQNAEFEKDWWFTFGMGYLARQAKPIWEKYTSKLSSHEILEIFERYDKVWAVEFAELGMLMEHPQVRAVDLVHEIAARRFVRAPWRVPWELPPLREEKVIARE